MTAENPPLSLLAQQNDAFRNGPAGIKGQRVHTHGIACLSPEVIAEIWAAVRDFDEFSADNDPYGEHDFGAIEHPRAGKVFWKIDYYDLNFRHGSEDPADPAKTRRLLTVMLAEEY